jgi:hypothetical protein
MTEQKGTEPKKTEAKFSFEEKERIRDLYFDSLKKVMKTNSSTPSHTPKNFLECFYLYKSGSTYRLYIYIDNTWKYINLN